jgi:glucan 1,3-beta-glucosidase
MKIAGGIIVALFFVQGSLGRWDYGKQKTRGVNLGSWLILEKWITPKPFEGLPDSVKDEYTLCKYLGYSAAQKRLRTHWDTWVTEKDFQSFKAAGLNHVSPCF